MLAMVSARQCLNNAIWYQIQRLVLLVALNLMLVLPTLAADPINLFRIGTGGSAGTYYPVGSLIAEAISERAGHQRDAAYIVPDLLGVAQRSNGSAANVEDIGDGLLEAGLAQADIAYWAYHGDGPFSETGANTKLRALATLYPESLHLVVRSGSGINAVTDLRGQRVSLDDPGSGTLIDVRLVLQAFGVSIKELDAVYLKPADAIERLVDGQLDAFFIIAGYPISAVATLIAAGQAELVPITGPVVDELLRETSFFARDSIPADAYQGNAGVQTLAVGAQLIVSADLDAELVYRITGMLWSAETRQLLTSGHPKGQLIQLTTALDGIGIPLHPGAERYYRQIGLDLESLR